MVRRSIGDVAGLYNLLLALGAISTGVYMLAGMGFFLVIHRNGRGFFLFKIEECSPLLRSYCLGLAMLRH